MIPPRTSKDQILHKLHQKRDRRLPIMIASAGSGLVAKLLEEAGVDCINTFSGARLRANGMGTMAMMWPILDSNEQTLRYTAEDIVPALSGAAFVCACLNPNDPLKDKRGLIERCFGMGVFSVSNIGPSVSYVDKGSQIRAVLEKSGVTFQNEIDFLSLAKQMGQVTIGLAFDEDESVAMCAQAQPHLFCFHAGTTQGGRVGFDSGETIERTAQRTEQAYRRIRAVAPQTLLLCHGAALENPRDAQYMLDHTSSDGFWTGSSTERLPIERAVSATAREFTALRFSAPGKA
jgi:predicted TIM-barrel enzyme